MFTYWFCKTLPYHDTLAKTRRVSVSASERLVLVLTSYTHLLRLIQLHIGRELALWKVYAAWNYCFQQMVRFKWLPNTWRFLRLHRIWKFNHNVFSYYFKTIRELTLVEVFGTFIHHSALSILHFKNYPKALKLRINWDKTFIDIYQIKYNESLY